MMSCLRISASRPLAGRSRVNTCSSRSRIWSCNSSTNSPARSVRASHTSTSQSAGVSAPPPSLSWLNTSCSDSSGRRRLLMMRSGVMKMRRATISSGLWSLLWLMPRRISSTVSPIRTSLGRLLWPSRDSRAASLSSGVCNSQRAASGLP